MLAENNYAYEEQDYFAPIAGWRKVAIVEITDPQRTKNGDATGFFLKLDVWDGENIVERSVFMSFDHPHEFVTTKSHNIGAMLRMMFPTVTRDPDYYHRSFWLLFRTYTDKKTGETKESFFDSKKRVSLDGKTTLEGQPITGTKTYPKPVAQPSQAQPDNEYEHGVSPYTEPRGDGEPTGDVPF